MADNSGQEQTSEKAPPKFELKIDPKKDPSGNPITGFEGTMVPWDSTRKKLIEKGDDEN